MKIPASVRKVIDNAFGAAQTARTRIARLYSALTPHLRNAQALLRRAWTRPRALAYRAQNIVGSLIVRLRTLYMSSWRYRSYVFMVMSGLAVSLVLVLALWLGYDGQGDQSADQQSDPAALDFFDEAGDGPVGSEQFPSDIFSDEILPASPTGEADPRDAPPAAPPSPDLGASDTASGAPENTGTQTSPASPDPVAAAERERLRNEAIEELRRHYDALSQELERLRQREEMRQEQNARSRQLFQEYEKEMQELRRRLEQRHDGREN